MAQDCGPFDADELAVIEEAQNSVDALRAVQKAETPTQQLVDFLKTAKPQRAATEAARRDVRKRQAAGLAEVIEEGREGGAATRARALKVLEEPLPKTVFDPPADVMSREDIKAMYNAIWVANLQQFTTLNNPTAR